ncbi:MAG: type II secretion system protein [Alphaproteobacteria bacterium]|nr:type II secretion system protein [Alphaproteobacteria bacterium]
MYQKLSLNGSARHKCGFTLIEIAISMMILGVIMASALSAYQVYKQKQDIIKTTEVVQTVNQALQTFKSNFGRYPCPAPILEPRNSANYGRQVRCDGFVAVPGPPPVAPALPNLLPNMPPAPGLLSVSTSNADMACSKSATIYPGREQRFCRITSNVNRYAQLGLSVENFALSYSPLVLNNWYLQPGGAITSCGFYTTNGQMVCEYTALKTAVDAKNWELQTQYNTAYATYQNDLAAYNAAVASNTGGDPAANLTPGQCLSGGTVATPTVNGVCVEQSARADLTNRNIRVGAIPFRDMQLDEKDTLDGYGNRLVYAVTQDMANVGTFREDGGGIRIIDSTGADLSNGAQSAAYVVFSSGQNGNGAVNANGVANACNANGGDSENCRNYSFGAAAPGTNTDATYRMDVTGNNYDDMMAYFVASENPVWRRTTPTAQSVTDLTRGNVGVGISDPAQITDTLTVGQSSVNYTNDSAQYGRLANVNGDVAFQTGSLRVGDGNASDNRIFAPQYCDQSGTNCFSVENIAAPYDPAQPGRGMGGCPAGQYMTGIEAGAAKCAPVRFYCTNPDEVFIGFNADGTPNCALPNNSCAATSSAATLCGSSYGFPMAGAGTEIKLPDRDDLLETNPDDVNMYACAQKTYTCNNGNWELKAGFPVVDDAAHCNYDPALAQSNFLTDTTASCSQALGQGYSGTYTQKYYYKCDGTRENLDSDTSSCVCNDVYATAEYNCPGNTSSAAPLRRIKHKACDEDHVLSNNWSCGPWVMGGTVSSSLGMITGGTIVSDNTNCDSLPPANACTCALQPITEFANCDGGGTRKSSPNPSSFQYEPSQWPADITKGKWRYRHVQQGQCQYNNPAWNDSNCTKMEETDPDCMQATSPQDPVACRKVQTKKKVRKIRSGNSWIDDPDTSGNTDGTCIARTYIWKPGSSPTNSGTGAYTGQDYPRPNIDRCTCDQVEKESSCIVTTTTGYTFFLCTCREVN